MFDINKVKNDCIQWIRDWFDQNGKGCKAVIGISGGKDSSIVAALCVGALGKDKVVGVLMPNGVQMDLDDAKELVRFLDIEYYVINIHNATVAIKHGVKSALDDHWSKQSSINLPARIRMATLYAVAQTVNGRVSNNCNLSEDWIGYSTRYGDSVGDFSPLSKLTATEVKQVGYELGLPRQLVDKVPSDGLCGKTDEDNLGFSYEALDNYIRTGICENEEVKAKIDFMHEKNKFKLESMPCFEFSS